ncbi:MAG: S9 family peptidase [Gemmatimonadaceae bacterium]|nr:S9 family peptidase [Gemmatimonadaceae bacterium]
MSRLLRWLPAFAVALSASPLSAQRTDLLTNTKFQAYFDVASPLSLATAAKTDRLAWKVYEKGMRNVYTAAAPSWKPVNLTKFMADDGVDISDIVLSDDGSVAVFVRGAAPNSRDWVPNPSHDPNGPERAIWAVRTAGTGAPWKVAVGAAPALSPDGRYVLYVKDGQIYRAPVQAVRPGTAVDRGEVPFIRAWGRQFNPQWSPDGQKIAFVSDRENHAFITVYDVKRRSLAYVDPSVDCDGNPVWTPDSKHLVFTRRPGTPFGAQSQQGTGGIGNPQGAAFNMNQALQRLRNGGFGPPCGGGFGFGGGGGGRGVAAAAPQNDARPGFFTARFAGGYTLSLMMADVETRIAKEVWHNQPGDRSFTTLNGMRYADGHVVFPATVPNDEWDRWFSINLVNPAKDPVLLTTTDGLIEGAGSVELSADGKTLFYCTNAKDIERRHIWAVPVGGGMPQQLTTGEGIETSPVSLPSGKGFAVLYYDWNTPASVGLVASGADKATLIYPTLGKSFPRDAHVKPQIVWTKAADGTAVSNQLFLPKDLKPGEKRPAMVFVHGGPIRQMLPGYHYMEFYHWAYAYNQWLAAQGYVVLSINYRRGIGYGRSFQNAPNTQAAGNAEYQDVVAGGKYLQSRKDVDPTRVGIWGLSYGGLLTSQALARNSDLFVAGADYAGVHLYGSSLDTAALSFRSSAVGAIDGWKSPVLLVHGDDDRNVDFAQTVGLVQLLRARNIYHEMIIIPDDVHESMLHKNWVDTWERTDRFLRRFVWNRERAPSMTP